MRRWAGGLLAALTLASCGSTGLSASQLRASAIRLCGVTTRRAAAIALPGLGTVAAMFLKIGFVFFGGGFVLIPVLHQRLVNELIEEGLPVLQPYLPSSVKIRHSHEQSLPMICLDPSHQPT